MSDPGEHGVPSPTAQAEDAWWDAVYEPTGREAAHRPSTGTVDDWFASALGAIGAAAPPAPRPPVDDEDLPPIPDLPPLPTAPPAPDLPPPPQLPDPRVIPPRAEREPEREPEPEYDPALDHEVLGPEAAPPLQDDWREGTGPAPEWEPAERSTAGDDLAPQPDADLAMAAPVTPPPLRDRPRGDNGTPAPPRSVHDDPSGGTGVDPAAAAAPVAPPPVQDHPRAEAGRGAEAGGVSGGVAAPPHVPAPTLSDGAALRWGRSRPAAGLPLPEPDALPEADPEDLGALVPDTVLELARHGSMTLRAASARGEESRALGAARRDRLVVARFGDGADGLLVTAVAAGLGAAEAVRMLVASVGRSRTGLLADLRDGAQEQLRFGLQRLTARAARGLGPAGAIHALLAPLDPTNRLRAGFGTGPGALLLLGDDAWYDAYAGSRLTNEPESAADAVVQQSGQFRFRAVVPEPGDVLLLCTEGLATPLREEPAVAALLAEHWSQPHAPVGVDFLRQIQARASGHSGDRTAAAIWEE